MGRAHPLLDCRYYELSIQLDSHYITERFGLLQIIIIGETILSVVSGAKASAKPNDDLGHFADILMCFVVVCKRGVVANQHPDH